MDIKEYTWLRASIHKLDKDLRAEIMGHYRSLTRVPCFCQKFYHVYKEKFCRFPVIIQGVPFESIEQGLYRTNTKKNFQRLELVDGYSAYLTLKEIKSIVLQQSVKKIFLDREIRALLDSTISTISSDKVWERGYTGKGVTIAILDSGIYPHPDFIQPVNRILAFHDFLNEDISSAYDDNGHGTHCAGAAAGNGFNSSGKYTGPAFESNLVALKILDKKGSGKTSQAIKALEWCLTNKDKYNIRIISLSLGYKASESYRDDPLCLAVGKVWEAGIVVCTAAGNEGPEENTIYSPGIHPDIITVGASDDKDTPDPTDDDIADFSSRGPTPDGLTKPDLLAPGANIISARAKGSFIDKTMNNSVPEEWYVSLSGTSMAAPICAGIAAQLLQAHPNLTPPEIKGLLLKSCFKVTSADANKQGHGCINALNALSLLNSQLLSPSSETETEKEFE